MNGPIPASLVWRCAQRAGRFFAIGATARSSQIRLWRFDTYGDKGRGRSPDENVKAGLPLLGGCGRSAAISITIPQWRSMRSGRAAWRSRGAALRPLHVGHAQHDARSAGRSARRGASSSRRRASGRSSIRNGWERHAPRSRTTSASAPATSRGNPEPLLIFTRGEPVRRDPPRPDHRAAPRTLTQA